MAPINRCQVATRRVFSKRCENFTFQKTGKIPHGKPVFITQKTNTWSKFVSWDTVQPNYIGHNFVSCWMSQIKAVRGKVSSYVSLSDPLGQVLDSPSLPFFLIWHLSMRFTSNIPQTNRRPKHYSVRLINSILSDFQRWRTIIHQKKQVNLKDSWKVKCIISCAGQAQNTRRWVLWIRINTKA